MSEAAARAIVERLRAAGHQALFAGGAVRDRLLGRAAQDFDVATDAHPEVVMRMFTHHTAVGARFGVVLVHLDEPTGAGPRVAHIEVATFRTDSGTGDGRHPDAVRYADNAREDVQRRDFTINGLLLDPFSGEVLDYVGGRRDLEQGVIRAIGDPERRFEEDHLRMLRGVRFAARLRFEFAPATFEAIQNHAAEIVGISPERIRDEILKMLTEGEARRAFELLDLSGLLAEVLPEVAAMKGVEQPPEYHPEGDVWTHTLMMLEALPHPCPATFALGVLLHDVGKPPTFRRAPDRIRFDRHAAIGARMAEAICRRLRLPGEETEQVVALVENHMRFIDLPNMRESTRARLLRRPEIEMQMELLRLDSAMSHGDLSLYDMARRSLAALTPEQRRPPRLLSGHDLMAMGYRPGPKMREMLEAIEDAQLEGRLGTAEAARAFVAEQYPMSD